MLLTSENELYIYFYHHPLEICILLVSKKSIYFCKLIVICIKKIEENIA